MRPFTCARPKGQIILPLVCLHLEVHRLPKSLLHPYQVAPCIQHYRPRTWHHLSAGTEENVGAITIASIIPLCDFDRRRVEIKGNVALGWVDAIEAKIVRVP